MRKREIVVRFSINPSTSVPFNLSICMQLDTNGNIDVSSSCVVSLDNNRTLLKNSMEVVCTIFDT